MALQLRAMLGLNITDKEHDETLSPSETPSSTAEQNTNRRLRSTCSAEADVEKTSQYPDLNDKLRELIIKALLARASIAGSRNRYAEMANLAEEARKVAVRSASEPLIARCAYYEGVADSKRGDWYGAKDCLEAARACIGHCPEGKKVQTTIDEANRQISKRASLMFSKRSTLSPTGVKQIARTLADELEDVPSSPGSLADTASPTSHFETSPKTLSPTSLSDNLARYVTSIRSPTSTRNKRLSRAELILHDDTPLERVVTVRERDVPFPGLKVKVPITPPPPITPRNLKRLSLPPIAAQSPKHATSASASMSGSAGKLRSAGPYGSAPATASRDKQTCPSHEETERIDFASMTTEVVDVGVQNRFAVDDGFD